MGATDYQPFLRLANQTVENGYLTNRFSFNRLTDWSEVLIRFGLSNLNQ
jgi:hypothetical protein